MDSLLLTLSMKQTQVQHVGELCMVSIIMQETDGATPHYAVIVHEWVDEKFPDRWIGRCSFFDWLAPSHHAIFSLGISKEYCSERSLYLNSATSEKNSESL